MPSSEISARLSLVISTVTERAGPVDSPGPMASAVMGDTDTTRAETSPPKSAAPVRGAVVPVGIARVATVSSTSPPPGAGTGVDTDGSVEAADVSEATTLLLLVGELEDGAAEPEVVVVRAYDDDATAVNDDEPAAATDVVDPEVSVEENGADEEDEADEDEADEEDGADDEAADPADDDVEDDTTETADDAASWSELSVAEQAPVTSREVSPIPRARLRRR